MKTSDLYIIYKQSPPLDWTHIFGTKSDAEWMCTVENCIFSLVGTYLYLEN